MTMNINFRPSIVVFHCINSYSEKSEINERYKDKCDIKYIKMPCSSMVKDVFLLRAFESDADAVIVYVCPNGICRHMEGNIRAAKRVQWVGKILDEIGLDHRRLAIFNISKTDQDSATEAIQTVLSDLNQLGPNPAAQNR